MTQQRSLLGSRQQNDGHTLTGDGALPLVGAAWDRSLLPSASAPWPHAHLREMGKEQRMKKKLFGKKVFFCDADDHVLAMTIKTL